MHCFVRLAALLALAVTGAPLLAAGAADSDSYDNGASAHGLRFADLEFAMPTDPLLWSADPGWEVHHTPARLLKDAEAQLRAVVPVGMPSRDAAAILRVAGARCAPATAETLSCTYKDHETPYGGDFWDQVTWRVRLSLAADRVTDLAVTRDWSRLAG